MENIPTEVANNIMARVGASSCIDLFSIQLSCKYFKKIAEDDYVYQNISMDKCPISEWKPLSEQQQMFIRRCEQSNNRDLIYRQGMKSCFTDANVNWGCIIFQAAENLGYIQAKYARVIVLLISNEYEGIQTGINLLKEMSQSRSICIQVPTYRTNFINVISNIWIKNMNLHLPKCCLKEGSHKRKFNLNSIEQFEVTDCYECNADIEIKKIIGYIPLH